MTTLERAARAAWVGNALDYGPFNPKKYEFIARAVLMAVLDAPEIETPIQEAVYAAGEQIPAGLPEAWRAAIRAITGTEP